MTDARRAGVAVLVVVLAGGAVLAALPDVGVIRVAGVTLRWWLGGFVAPLLAAIAGTLLIPRADARARALAAWTGPALVAALVGHVATGDPSAATLALLACTAPLLVLLTAPSAPRPSRDVVSRAVGGIALGLVLTANLAALADLARSLGADRRIGVLAGATLVAATVVSSRRLPLRPVALAAGAAGLVLPVLAVGAGAGSAPWTAWARLADRPSIVFGAHSAWVTEGRGLVTPTTLLFEEPHRVTAAGAGTWRVVEHEGERATVRDWRLAGGESLELRPGDTLTPAPGARLRLEAGKRVPGAPGSGTTWAEGRAGGGLAGLTVFLGGLVTLGGGAWLLLAGPSGRRPALPAAPGLVTVVAVAAASWGIYAAFAGADLTLGVPPIAALTRVPAALVAAPWPPLLAACAVAGLAALFVAAADALRERVGALAGAARPRGRAASWAVLAGAGALALGPGDAWRWLVLGCGLAAAAGAAPALAAGDPRARAAGAAAGALVLGALAAAAGGLEAAAWPAPALSAWPALAAAPLAWGVTRVLAR